MKFCWIVTLLSAVAAGFTLIWTTLFATSAPQQAAGFANACALAIVPYVFTRAIQGLASDTRDEGVDRIVHAIDKAAAQAQEHSAKPQA